MANLETVDPGSVEVKSLNFSALMADGQGILHTKMFMVDRKHFYVGSNNYDWRSFTQVKEMGVLVRDCPVLAEDMGKIMDVYWQLGGQNKSVPDRYSNAGLQTWPRTPRSNPYWPQWVNTFLQVATQFQHRHQRGPPPHGGEHGTDEGPPGRLPELVAATILSRRPDDGLGSDPERDRQGQPFHPHRSDGLLPSHVLSQTAPVLAPHRRRPQERSAGGDPEVGWADENLLNCL